MGNGGRIRSQSDQSFHEQAGISWGILQRTQDRPLNASHCAGGRLANHLTQPGPPCGRGNVYHLAHAGCAQPEQHFGGAGIVLRDQGYRGDAGKLPDKMAQYFNLLGATPMNRHQHRVHRTFSHDAHGIGNGVSMDHSKAAAAGCIYPRSLHRQQDCCHRGGLGQAERHNALPSSRVAG